MYFINSLYSQDAGCPIFPFDFISDIDYYVKGKDFKFIDLNLHLYQKVYDFYSYELPKALFGGYTYNIDKAEDSSISSYKFEALPSAKLLLSLIYIEDFEDKRVQEILKRESDIWGLDFAEIKGLLGLFQEMFIELCEPIRGEAIIYVSMPSVASVFAGVWFSAILKRKKSCKIIGIGNQINVPEIANFILATGIIDEIENPKIKKDFNNFNKKIYESLKDIFFQYPTYYGTRIIPFQVSYGCSGKCNYCTERKFWDRHGNIRDSLENRNIEECIKELSYFIEEYKISGITFDDCMINLKAPQFLKLKQFLLEKQLFLSGSMRMDIIDDEMIQLLHELNFTNIIIGLETLNSSSMKKYNKSKKNYYIENAWRLIPKLHKSGIMAQINMIFDSPYEEKEDVAKAIEEDKKFISYLKKENVPINHISIGEIVINYPSEQYFKIIKDDRFSIFFQETPECLLGIVPDKVREYFEQIPYRAQKNEKSAGLSKCKLVKQVSSLLEISQEERISSSVDIMMVHWKKYYETWLEQNVSITLNTVIENQNKLQTDSNLVNELLKTKKMGIKKCTSLCSNNQEKTVRMLLTMTLAGLLEIGE